MSCPHRDDLREHLKNAPKMIMAKSQDSSGKVY